MSMIECHRSHNTGSGNKKGQRGRVVMYIRIQMTMVGLWLEFLEKKAFMRHTRNVSLKAIKI